MKIVVSVDELSNETQAVIDNMLRSKAPVMIGDGNSTVAVLLSAEEYERLKQPTTPAAAPAAEKPQPVAPGSPAKQAAAPVAGSSVPPPAMAAPARAPEITQPMVRPLIPKDSDGAAASPVKQPAVAEVVPATQHSEIAQRTAAAIQADRSAPPAQPKVVSQRAPALQAEPRFVNDRSNALRGVRLTKPLPKPPRPIGDPRTRDVSLLTMLRANWQTIALMAGVLVLGVLGFVLILNAIGG